MRYSGLNWEGRRWNTPVSIRSLGGQITSVDGRPSMYDGTVASKQHDKVSPNSDHRPTPHRGPGIVRAMDVTVTDLQGDVWTDSIRLSEDPRVRYVIYRGRKFNGAGGPYPWGWKPYLGLNPHEEHFHVSTNPNQDNNSSTWDLNGGTIMTGPNGEPQWDKVSEWAKASWTTAWQAGLLTVDSDPQDPVEMEQLMVILNRANVV